MKSQYTITPITRSLLVLAGLAAIAALMFLKDASPITNWLALTAIIPLTMGMVGENLLLAIFSNLNARSSKDKPIHKTASMTQTDASTSNTAKDLEKRAA